MPSPHYYDELDSKPELAAVTAPEIEARQDGDTFFFLETEKLS